MKRLLCLLPLLLTSLCSASANAQGGDELVSVDENGTAIQRYAWGPSVSESGRYVSFVFLPNGSEEHPVFYRRDRQLQTTRRVPSPNNYANGYARTHGTSRDGRYTLVRMGVENGSRGLYLLD